MKQRTGMEVEVEVWRAYGELCGREKLSPAWPWRSFSELALKTGS
jgi:hypothetical protein